MQLIRQATGSQQKKLRGTQTREQSSSPIRRCSREVVSVRAKRNVPHFVVVDELDEFTSARHVVDSGSAVRASGREVTRIRRKRDRRKRRGLLEN